MNQIMLTLGLSLILQNLALVFFQRRRALRAHGAGLHLEPRDRLGGHQLSRRSSRFIGSVLCTLGIWYFLKITDTGRAIRAAAQNPTAATLRASTCRWIYLLAFGSAPARSALRPRS